MQRSVPRRPAPRQAPTHAPPAPIAARIILQRDDVLVLDKPAGLPVHRGPRGGASLEDWLEPLRMGRRHVPQPAHRLDTDTAGCLVLGRTKPALAALGRIFAQGLARKTYWAVVRGGPAQDDGVIDLPLRKTSSAARGWRMEAHATGQPATTRWRVMGRAAGTAWLELTPLTGRTHQLRVHCAAAGFPILGDPVYGANEAGGLQLLAQAIALPLDPPVAATAPVPEHMRAALRACGHQD
ncbi:RluA family pseudouridine synthase [Roseomonas sp. CECT 9278]|uniref:RluA family pseudouridine synthase n=1 Tax=Roseomonas sp. CECT 9278 TaxID=2845823 RepID=UPI001E3D1DC5|nr:RNA pseudouridine synthase [Roseomonas sp. CECT 9278]CAH0281835.1 Dual-specificity RNA pseudouridine synthase RluA [Roseomonas sp. CECT 9278]